MKGSKNQKRNTSGGSAPHKGREKRRAAASRKARRRKRLLLIFYLVTFLIAIGAAVVLSITVLFRIDTIQVTGQSRYTEQEIVQMRRHQSREKTCFWQIPPPQNSRLRKSFLILGGAKVSRRLPAKNTDYSRGSGNFRRCGIWRRICDCVLRKERVLEITSATPGGIFA